MVSPFPMRFLAVRLLILALFLFPRAVSGDTTGLSGFDLRLYRPPTDGSGVLNVHGSRALGRWQFAVGSALDTSDGMVTVVSPITGGPVTVVDDYFTNTFFGSVGLANFFQVGLSIPTVYFESGNHVSNGERYETASIGDIGLEMKLALLKDAGFRPGLALVSVTTFPSGDTGKFTGYSNVSQEAKLVIDKKIGPVYLAANGGYRMIERTQVADLDVDDLLTYGAGFSWALPFGALELIAEADGALVVRNPTERTSPMQWLAGIRQKPAEGLSIDFAAGTSIGSGVGGGDFRIIGGFQFRSSPEDKKAPTETFLSETISFEKGQPRVDRKSRPVLERVAEVAKREQKSEVELLGDPELMRTVTYDLMDLGLSRGRISQIESATPESAPRTVHVRVVR